MFINKCDLVQDQELLELVELEVRELLDQYGFDGEATPVIRGSAMRAHDEPENAEMRRCIEQLVEALDQSIPDPPRATEKPFLMPIENVYSIAGRGTVVTGRIEQGEIRSGDNIEIVGLASQSSTDVVTQVEAFGRAQEFAVAGENVGCLLRKTDADAVSKGQVIAFPNSLQAEAKFEAEVYVLQKEEGGRHTPFLSGYTPQFFFRTADVTGKIEMLGEVEMAMPGDGARMLVTLMQPVAFGVGDRFAIREGGKTIGSGTVAKLIR